MQHLLAGAAPSPEMLADSAAGEPDVAHLLLEAAREANLELARDAETDANMLEVRRMQSMGSRQCLSFLAPQSQNMISRSGLFCCCARSNKIAVSNIMNFGVPQTNLA